MHPFHSVPLWGFHLGEAKTQSWTADSQGPLHAAHALFELSAAQLVVFFPPNPQH